MKKRKPKNQTIIQTLEKYSGIIAPAAKHLGVARKTLYAWINQSKELQDALQDIREVQKDFAESKLLQNINSNDTGAIKFYLKTQGKDRGYVEKQENELSGSINTVHELIQEAEKDLNE